MRFALLVSGFLALSGAAQAATQAPATAAKPVPTPAKTVAEKLDSLFGALSKAGSAEEAKPIEEQILALFLQSGSPSIDLLMQRAAVATGDGKVAEAKQLLDSITALAPGYAEGWHTRARVLSAVGDDQGAMLSLQKAVALNPRQFEALSELAGMLEEYGDKPGALALYRRALALDPNLESVAREVRALTRAVEGERT